MTLTQKQYMKNRGIRCPACDTSKVETTDNGQLNAGGGVQGCMCVTCGATWTDIYTLTGYDNLEVPK